jgi:hypothetical protein
MKTYTNQNKSIYLFRGNLSLINKYILCFDKRISHNQLEVFTQEMKKRCKNRGSLDTISWIKDLRVSIYNYLGGYKSPIWNLKVTKDGIPVILTAEVRSLLRKGDIRTIRFVLTLFQASRFLKGQKSPDFTPITDTSSSKVCIQNEYSKMIHVSMKELNLSSRPIPVWKGPHFTSKGSPSGPAMLSIENDLSNLSDGMISSIGMLGGEILESYIDRLRANPNIIQPTKEPKPERKSRLRSHGLVEDTEGKTRIVAMADYWTQTCLYPLHADLLSALKNIGEMDLTFGQDIKPFGRESQSYYSFDLTSATDRLPRFLYVELLGALYGKKLAYHWEQLMISEGYHGPDGVIRNYNTGQPMGLYSSWPLLALVHHCIVQMSALRIGLRGFKEYRILGDDIVIRHDNVAAQYQETLSQLGVGLSKQKSLISKDTFEFAKRLFYKGEEVTAFPLHGISSAVISGWQDIYSVMDTASQRNFGSIDLLIKPRLIEGIHKVNAIPIFLKSLALNERREIRVINSEIKNSARARALRIGRVAYGYMCTFSAMFSQKSDNPLFQGAIDFWDLNITCVTDKKSSLQVMTDRYTNELASELLSSLTKTVEHLEKYTKCSPEWLGALRARKPQPVPSDITLSPLAWCMYDQAVRLTKFSLTPPVLMMMFRKVQPRNWLAELSSADPRILDPTILDRSRRFERTFRLASSSAVKAFAKYVKDLSKLLPKKISLSRKSRRSKNAQ